MNERRKAHTPEQTADLIGCCRATVFSEINAGRLKAKKLGKRTLILDEDLTAYLRALPAREPNPKAAA